MAEPIAKESPFIPGRPVPIEYFVARTQEIQRLERAIKQSASGRNENIFISGERGIGKSSLAGFIRYIAEKQHNFIGNHCYLGGVTSLEEMTYKVFHRLLQEADQSLFEKFKSIFGKHIKGIQALGFGVEFTQDEKELHSILENFIPILRKIFDSIKESKRGLILILDDLNGITNLPAFSHFIKSFVDELATSQYKLPIMLVLVGIPERREEMIKHQPSITRIFNIVELSPMNDDESKDFFIRMFDKKDIRILPDALSLMANSSGGLPMLMHEVGDAIFWENKDDIINIDDSSNGIIFAAYNIGKKYLDPHVYRALRSKTYKSILGKISSLNLGTVFNNNDLQKKTTRGEQKRLSNFLQRMKVLRIINNTENRGEYTFSNQLYHLYFRLEAFRAKKEKNNNS